MVWRAVVIVAAGYVTGRILTWVTGVTLGQLLATAPELWLIIAGIPLATLAALVIPERAWHRCPPPAPQPRVRGYIEPATMPAMAAPTTYAALPGPQVVHHYHHHTHELIAPAGRMPLPPVVVEGIESPRRAALPAPRPRTGL